MAIQIKSNPDFIVYLMRGLPSSGKSYTAQKLTQAGGIICETDEYFYRGLRQSPRNYRYSDAQLQTARDWNFERFSQALQSKITPIVVDRGNGLDVETQRYVKRAIAHGYKPILREPESPIWKELRPLLVDINAVEAVTLERWIEKLYQLNQFTHRTPRSTIRDRLMRWKFNLSISDILSMEETPSIVAS